MRIALILLIMNCFPSISQVAGPPTVELPEFVPDSFPDNSVVMIISCPPEFSGGDQSMMSYIQSKMSEVSINWADSIPKKRGRVTFIVEKDGSLTDIKIYQSVTPEIDSAMISMVEEMPNWQPACDQYGTVRERVLLPVTFFREE